MPPTPIAIQNISWYSPAMSFPCSVAPGGAPNRHPVSTNSAAGRSSRRTVAAWSGWRLKRILVGVVPTGRPLIVFRPIPDFDKSWSVPYRRGVPMVPSGMGRAIALAQRGLLGNHQCPGRRPHPGRAGRRTRRPAAIGHPRLRPDVGGGSGGPPRRTNDQDPPGQGRKSSLALSCV
jgi:hypothetical protein